MSSDVPMIGASGAISAVLGAYLVLFPGARIQSLVFLGLFYQLIAVPAVLVLGFWFVLKLFDAIGWIGAGGDDRGRVLRPRERVPGGRPDGAPVPAPRRRRRRSRPDSTGRPARRPAAGAVRDRVG